MTPRMQAIAFRVWQYANPKGWDCTAGEIADAIGVHHTLVGRVCVRKGWGTRLRTTHQEWFVDWANLGGAGLERLDESTSASAILASVQQ